MPLIENPIEDGEATKTCMRCRHVRSTASDRSSAVVRMVCAHPLRVIYTQGAPIYRADVFPNEWCQLWEMINATEPL